jgi:tRNA nucleotidyltransferase (CCA-adding enzyme)
MPETAALRPPKAVREIAATLEDAGHETWCVGGAVRDALLGRAHLDWDLATAATPAEVRKLFRRTVALGVDFGTVGVIDRQGIMHEVTTFRRDVQTDGRHAIVEFGVSLDEDLARRDFTINAIAFSPSTRALHDPFGGREDLRRGIVRAVGTPAERMREDRLRALRALRFAARFGFEIDAATWRAIVDSAPQLTRLSRERVRQELEKSMDQVAEPSRALALWRRSGALQALLPELAPLPDVAFRAADAIARPDATMRPELASARRRNRLATLFLDLEPPTARTALRELRFSNRDVEWIAHVVACWHELAGPMRESLASPGGARGEDLRRWAARTRRTSFRDFFRVACGRWHAERAFGRPAPSAENALVAYRRGLRIAYRDPIELADLAVDGEDLIAAGIPAGPRVGELLRALLDAVLGDPALNERGALLSLARSLDEPRDDSPRERR